MPNTPVTTTRAQLAAFLADGRGMAMLIYALLFFMVLTMGVTGIVALILATFADSDKTPDWIRSHYQFQVRTFWIGIVPTLAIIFLFLLVVPALIGALARIGVSVEVAKIAVTFLTVMPVLGWAAARCSMGFNHLLYHRPYPNPKAWLV